MARERWSSTAGFVLASVGSAVGIENLWRFPYVVGTNGGGAFLVAFVVALLLCGLPLLIVELSLGQRFRASVVPTFERIDRRLRLVGLGLVLVPTLILAYYLVITGWVLAYVVVLGAGRSLSFSDFTGSYWPLACFAASGVLCLLVVRRGVERGLERAATVLVPGLFAVLLGLVGMALTLPGARPGVSFYLTPDFGRLADPTVWTAAFGQAFFSLGIGEGIMLTYGSYLARGSITRSAVAITAADLLVALLGGLIVFPIVFSLGVDPAAGVELAFVTLPPVFAALPLGPVLGALFVLLLFVAAMTSAVSLLEVPVATLIDVRGMARPRATALVMAAVLLAGLPAALSYTPVGLRLAGVPVLDLQDFAVGTVGLIAGGLVLSLVVGWGVPLAALLPGPAPWVRRALVVAVRLVIPVVLAVTLLLRLVEGR